MTESLARDVLLLGTKPVGTTLAGMSYLVAGATLADLSARGRIRLDRGRVVVDDGSPTGDGVLDAVLADIGASSRRRSGGRWVDSLARPTLKRQREVLVAVGVLGADRRAVLGLIPWTTYPVRDQGARAALLRPLQDVVAGVTVPDPRTRTLLSLLRAAGDARAVTALVFPGTDRRTVRRRLTELTDDHWTTVATRRAVQGARARTA